jgi:hypothetical protein
MKTNRPNNSRRTARIPMLPKPAAEPEAHRAEQAMAERGEAREVAAPVTEVAAKIDVGFGNQVFIRGQGDGLSWDKGTPLRCKDASTWVWSSRQARDRVVFKLLLNDQVWAQGEDLTIEAGRKLETAPLFQSSDLPV